MTISDHQCKFCQGAEPSDVNHAGFSPWMVVGELLPMPDSSHSDPRADDIRECLELLKPKRLPEELLQAETPEDGGAYMAVGCPQG